MTYFSFPQQVTGSDLNMLQRDIDSEVRQLKSSIQDFKDKLLFTGAITILGWIYVFLIAYLLTLHK